MVIGVLFFSVRKGLEHSYRGEYFKSYATAGRLSGRERHLLWSIQKKIHCNALAEEMRREFPEITWVSAKLSGTRLSFEIREGDTKLSEETSKAACNLFQLWMEL